MGATPTEVGSRCTHDALHTRVDAAIGSLRARYLRALDVVLTYRASFGTFAVALFLMAAGVVAFMAIGRGGLPEGAGEPSS